MHQKNKTKKRHDKKLRVKQYIFILDTVNRDLLKNSSKIVIAIGMKTTRHE